MPKLPSVLYDRSMIDHILKNYLFVTTPMFDRGMGKRLMIVRTVYLGLTQRQLADKLGLTQADISRLENGRMITAPLTCAAFKSVLGKHLEHVLIEDGYYRPDEISLRKDKQIRKLVGSKRNSNNV